MGTWGKQLDSERAYDAAGNMLVVNANALTYDAENRQVSVTAPPAFAGVLSSTPTMAMVGKSGSSGATIYVYDAAGQLAAEYPTVAISFPCSTCYLSTDYLGATRLITDQNANVISRHDFAPFGEEILVGQGGRDAHFGPFNDTVNQQFTGKERDYESGLDYFGARYYGSALGRWTSPDLLNVTNDRLLNPSRTFNKYIYGANNPPSLVDPDGRDVVALFEPPHGLLPGHFMVFANNPTSGQSGPMSFDL